MKTDKPKVAGYGLHYHANNALIPVVLDRVLFQYLIDVVRKQLAESLDDQTVIISLGQLGRITGIDPYRSIPACLNRLEKLGLIKKHKNGITINCDEYVTIVKCYESLPKAEREQFAKDFAASGTEVLQKCSTPTILQGRAQLIGLSGSSLPLGNADPYKNVGISNSESQNPTILKGYPYNNVGIQKSEVKNPTFLQGYNWKPEPDASGESPTFLQGFALSIAKTLHFCRGYCNFAELSRALTPTFLQGDAEELVKFAFETGKFPESFINELKNPYIFVGATPTFLQGLEQKALHFCRTVIIEDKIKDKRDLPSDFKTQNKNEGQKNFQNLIKKGFESFSKVEVVDLNQPSKEVMPLDVEEDISRLKLKRAEKALRDRNPYRAKPFIQVKRVVDMVNFIDEVVKSPVDIFINLFWEGLYNLYLDHYNPSQRIDEEGELVNEPQDYNWKEMLGAPLPQDEIYRLAQNIYADLVGAVEQGSYLYDEDTNFRVKFDFKEFPDFNPCQIFQWQPCTMKDKGIPALKVAMDRFFDIEAPDVSMPSKRDKRSKVLQNRKFIQSLLGAEDEALLTPLERAIRAFYGDFVALGEESIIDQFKDGRGEVLDYAGRFPDHLLKPWCCGQPGITYKEFTGAFASKYKPIDGLHKRSYVFSAEAVVEWNERNGYRDSLAHHAVQEP